MKIWPIVVALLALPVGAATLQLNGGWAVVLCSDATFVHKAADDSLVVTCPSDKPPQRTIVVKPCHNPKLNPVSGGYALSC